MIFKDMYNTFGFKLIMGRYTQAQRTYIPGTNDVRALATEGNRG